MDLINIKDSTQKVSEAISAILNLDVTIIDSNMNRVAATGRYQDKIGSPLPNNCYFEIIGIKKEAKFVDLPNTSKKCINCELQGSCQEMGSLGYPILGEDGSLLGIIGVLAFNKDQQLEIKNNYNNLLTFLNRLAELLVANLNYTNTINKLTIQDKLTNILINEIDNGLILTDNLGWIKIANIKALNYFNLEEKNINKLNIKDLIKNISLDDNINKYVEYKIDYKGGKEGLMIKNIPIYINDKIENNIFQLNKTSNMIQSAYNLMKGTQKILFDDIIGESKEIKDSINLAKNVAKSDATVLIRGESGTGKDLFARAIHESGPRANFPFITVNCASIPDSLLESEFFGYEKGAFTGAKKDGHIGKFELANGGTLFLDEIGDMPLHLQPKLLRVLQNKSFVKIGGKEVINTDFRLITATNKCLEDMIETGEFREDLYYRLKVIPIDIPPLRLRSGDVDILIDYFIKRHCNKLNIGLKTFSNPARKALESYNWSGNVRELENVIEFLANTVEDMEITLDNLPLNIRIYQENKKEVLYTEGMDLDSIINNYEKKVLQELLENHGNSTDSKKYISKILNINLSTLYRKLNKHGL